MLQFLIGVLFMGHPVCIRAMTHYNRRLRRKLSTHIASRDRPPQRQKCFFQSFQILSTVSTCAYEEWEGKERRGKERKGSTCATGEKDTLRGTRTHTFCFPGSCPNPVRLEETSQSPFSVDDDVSTLTITDSNYEKLKNSQQRQVLR